MNDMHDGSGENNAGGANEVVVGAAVGALGLSNKAVVGNI